MTNWSKNFVSLFFLYLLIMSTERCSCNKYNRAGEYYRQQLGSLGRRQLQLPRILAPKLWDCLIRVLELVPKRTFTPPADRETRKPPGTLRNPTEQRCQDVSHIIHIHCAEARRFSLELSKKIMPSV